MKSFYPQTTRDRFLFWLAASTAVIAVIYVGLGDYVTAAMNVVATIYNYSLSFFARDKVEQNAQGGEYARVISRINSIGTEIDNLREFLVREEARVRDAEVTVQRLHEERSALEPVVKAHQETVDGILGAHSKRIARNAWKERLIGFGLGILASVVASVIYEYLKR